MEKAAALKTEVRRAAIYARVSDQSQAEEDRTSLSEQTAEMEAYCERRGLTVAARYQEVGRGWSKERPEFQRMLADARLRRFETIVSWKSDRLSRGLFPAAALMEVVEAYQIQLESVTDYIDMKFFGLMAAIAKIELDNFRERSSMGKRGAAKQGRIPSGNLPYGYRTGEDGKPEVVEAEATVVRRIFDQYVHEEMGIPSITRLMMDEGVPTAKPGGKRWHESHVHRILANEVYKGNWWYGKSRHISTEHGRQRHRQPEDTWIPIPFPRLVDEWTWDQAQSLKELHTSRAKRNTRVFYMLQHLVRCSGCGMLLGGRASKQNTVRRNGKVYHYDLEPPRRYYQCYGMQKRLFKCRKHPFIRADRLEDLIWEQIAKVVRSPEIIVTGLEALSAGQDTGLEEAITQAERDLRDTQLEEDRMLRLFVSGKIDEDQLDRQRQFVTERLKHCQDQLENYRAREAARKDKHGHAEHITQWARTIEAVLDNLGPEERQEVLKLLLDNVTIDADNCVSITLTIPLKGAVAIDQPTTLCWWRQ